MRLFNDQQADGTSTDTYNARGQRDIVIHIEGNFDGATLTLEWQMAQTTYWNAFQDSEGIFTEPGISILSLRRVLTEEMRIRATVSGAGGSTRLWVTLD